ncbi:MAG: DNA N-6-adenine-methyltransferase [Veillonellales bacterium]
MNEVHFSHERSDWETPQDLYDKLNEEFNFNIDVCATAENAKHSNYISPEQDGLQQDWRGVCWMNPPYGREIGNWIRKAYEESRKGCTVVCLLPSRTDTCWWHEYVMKGEIRFIRGRLKFAGAKNAAPFPSVIVIFRPKMRSISA